MQQYFDEQFHFVGQKLKLIDIFIKLFNKFFMNKAHFPRFLSFIFSLSIV